MSQDKDRIKDLEKQVSEKDQELSAVHNEIIKLNEQLGDLIQQISHELRGANAIQKTLVPTEIPFIPGFEFSTKFEASLIAGGDYFDIFEFEEKFRFGIILSSATGHGMSSLLLSVLLKLSGRKQSASPAESLNEIAQELIPNIQNDDSASIFKGYIDRRHLELTYCQAGHLNNYFFSAQGNKLERLKPTAATISKDFKQKIGNETISLSSRDRLILCSPGLSKGKNSHGVEFGEENLFKTIAQNIKLPPHELRNEILFEFQQFSAGHELEKDVTLMVIEVQDKVIKLAKS